MAKLKLGRLEDEKPIKLTIELPAALHRDLLAYAAILGTEHGQKTPEPAKLIVPMLMRFIATDREFRKRARQKPKEQSQTKPAVTS